MYLASQRLIPLILAISSTVKVLQRSFKQLPLSNYKVYLIKKHSVLSLKKGSAKIIKQTRANFNIDHDVWFIFKTIVGKQTTINDDGTERQAKPADVLKEFIIEYILENQSVLKEILKEAKKLNVNNSVTATLEEMTAETEENE